MAIVVAGGSSLLSGGTSLLTNSPAPAPAPSKQFIGPESYPDVPPNYFAITNNANTITWHVGGGVYRVQKIAGAAGTYDASAVSSIGATGDFVLRLRPIGGATNYGAGVNSDPLTNDSYDSVDHLWLFVNDNTRAIYENGSSVAAALLDATYAWIWRTGSSLSYGRGATLAAAQAAPDRTVTDSSTLYFDSSLTDVADEFEATFYFPDLTGQTLATAQGSATATTSVALTGQALSVARGSVLQGAPLVGQGLTVTQGSSVAALSIALTGQSVTASRGSVVATVSFALTGQSLSAVRGSATPTISKAITGQSLVAAQGSVAASLSPVLTGQVLTVSRGSVLAAASIALNGRALTAARGIVTIPIWTISATPGGSWATESNPSSTWTIEPAPSNRLS